VASLVNNRRDSGALAAQYAMTGSIGAAAISVDPLKVVTTNNLLNEFGNTLPIAPRIVEEYADNDENTEISPPANASYGTDPFSKNAFDRSNVVVTDNPEITVTETVNDTPKEKYKSGKKSERKSVDKKFGVTINRGMHH
jgi:hypothetical protein